MPNEASAPRRRGFKIFKGDPVIWVVFLVLCAVSIIEVYSATSTLAFKEKSIFDPIRQHTTFVLMGVVTAWIFHHIPCRLFKLYGLLALILSFFALIYLQLGGGGQINETSRWLPIFGVRVQPSELAKGAVIITEAFILSFMQGDKGADRHAIRYILFVAIPICLLIFTENLSTAVLLGFVVVALMVVGRVPSKQIGSFIGILLLLGILVGAIVKALPEQTVHKVSILHRVDTWENRILSFGTKDSATVNPRTVDLTNKKAQENHAKIAIATSHLIGKLPGNSVERNFLSQAFSDFIFAIIIEELGLIISILIMFLYIILFFRVGRIAKRCERNFPAFLIMGLALLITTQAFINMAVAVGAIPVTGQPLPFISRGGSSMLINSTYIGMILSVSRFAKRRELPRQTPDEGPVRTEAEFVDDRGLE